MARKLIDENHAPDLSSWGVYDPKFEMTKTAVLAYKRQEFIRQMLEQNRRGIDG